ncbi:CAP domain-containing protein [Kribbella catacumbae]|uniref:CAP domain-containing protein n=1 Tax=Kribbella catacumbae TaxID=460086 RepID=UPI000379AA76|nr:CAP domain-containing protein [Kribbella catacumbae]
MNDAPNDPFYPQNQRNPHRQQNPQNPHHPQRPEPPRSHGRRKQRGVAGPILGALSVLALVAGAGWYVTRDDTKTTSQDKPLTTETAGIVTPSDDASSPIVTPTKTPSKTPSATPSKTPSKRPSKTPTPTRSTSAPSREGTRSPKPSTKPTPRPSHTATPTPTKTTKPPAPSGGAEAQVLQLTNNERAKSGCGPLRTNSALTRAADLHATDMVARHYFDHTSLDGRSPFDRMKAAGFKGGAMAENIAVGYKSAAAVVDGWMKSEGHRRNILNCDYTMIGIGYDGGQVKPDWGNGSWVQNFGG